MNEFIYFNKLFYILLLGHLIGDFVLQTDNIFYLKKNFIAGQVLHAFLVSIITLIIIFFYFDNYLLSLAIFVIILITHFTIDYIKLLIHKSNPVYFLLDQLLHILVIYVISIIFNKNFEIAHLLDAHFRYIYLLCSFIVVSLFIKYFNLSFYTFFKIKHEKTKMYNYIVFIEKVIIFIFAYMHGFYFLLIPIVIIPRILISIKSENEYTLYDILLSMLFSAFFGIMLRKLTLSNPFSLLNILVSIIIISLIGTLIRNSLQFITRKL